MDRSSEPAYWPPEEDAGEPGAPQTVEEEPGEPPRSSRTSGIAALFGALLVVGAWNAWQLRVEVPEPTPREEAAVDRVSLFVAAQEVEAHREAEGSLPASLSEIGLESTGLRYQVSGDSFRLESPASGEVLEVASPDSLLGEIDGLLPRPDRSERP